MSTLIPFTPPPKSLSAARLRSCLPNIRLCIRFCNDFEESNPDPETARGKNRGIFWIFFFQHCFICRPSVSEDAGIEPRTCWDRTQDCCDFGIAKGKRKRTYHLAPATGNITEVVVPLLTQDG